MVASLHRVTGWLAVIRELYALYSGKDGCIPPKGDRVISSYWRIVPPLFWQRWLHPSTRWQGGGTAQTYPQTRRTLCSRRGKLCVWSETKLQVGPIKGTLYVSLCPFSGSTCFCKKFLWKNISNFWSPASFTPTAIQPQVGPIMWPPSFSRVRLGSPAHPLYPLLPFVNCDYSKVDLFIIMCVHSDRPSK